MEIPKNTKDVCCICGQSIPQSDFRSYVAHEGTTHVNGKSRFVYREAHLNCSPSKTGKRPLW